MVLWLMVDPIDPPPMFRGAILNCQLSLSAPAAATPTPPHPGPTSPHPLPLPTGTGTGHSQQNVFDPISTLYAPTTERAPPLFFFFTFYFLLIIREWTGDLALVRTADQ
jgi:hypothetical protein